VSALRALRERGQSETLGVALLTGIVLILVALVGLFLFADFGADDEEQLLANIDGDVEATNITLNHAGGDKFEPENVNVVLTGDAERNYTLEDDFDAVEGGGGAFAPGDIWESNSSGLIIGEGRMLVIHQPTNTILLDQPYSIEQDGLELAVENYPTGNLRGDSATIHGNANWSYAISASLGGTDYEEGDSGINYTIDFEGSDTSGVNWYDDGNHEIEVGSISSEKTVTANATIFREDGTPLNDTGKVNLTVKPEPEFSVSITDAVVNPPTLATNSGQFGTQNLINDTELMQGDTLAVTAEITNANEAAVGEKTVQMDGDMNGMGGEKTVSLDGGNSTEVTFTATVPDNAPPGMHSMTIWTEDDNDTMEMMVNSPASFDVNIVSIDDPVGVGESLDVTGEISNTGTLQGTQQVELELGNGAALDTKTVTLAGETSTQRTFTVTTVNPAGAWPVTLSSANESDTATALVLEFNLAFTASTDGEAVARNSDDVTLDLEVSHTATPSELDGQSVSTNVTLDPGSLTSGTFSEEFTFDSSDPDTKTMTRTFTPSYAGLSAGDFTVNANEGTTGATASTAVTVKKSDLRITSLSAPDSVTFGNDISVQTTVENQGNLDDMGRVQLVATNADGSEFIADDTSFNLDGGNSISPTLTFSQGDIVDSGYGEGDTVDFRVEVVNANTTDSRTGSVDLTDTGSGVVSLDSSDTNSPVIEGETIEATPTVNLVGISGTQSTGSLGTQDISTNLIDLVLELKVTDGNGNSIGTDSLDLTLADLGSILNPTLSVPTGQDDAGSYTATVELLGIIEASDSAPVTVEPKQPDLQFDFTTAPNQLTIGGSTSDLAVDYSVTNVGNAEASTIIDLSVDKTTGSEDSAALNVAPGESASGTLTYSNFASDYGPGETINWDVSLADYGGSSSGTTDVAGDPASFDVSILGTNNPDAGNQLTVGVEVTNTGDKTGTVDVSMSIPSIGSKTKTMQDVTGGELRTHTFTFGTSSDDAGTHTATADTGDNTATTQVTIKGANIQIVSASGPSQIAPGDNLDIDYTLENVGTKDGTEGFVDLYIDGSLDTWNSDVTVPAGGTESGTLTFDETGSYSDGDTINWEVELYDFGGSTSGNVAVSGSGGGGGGGTASFAVSITGTNSPVKEGNVLDVDVQIDNIGGAQGTQTIDLSTGGLGSASTSVTLGAGDSTTETLSVSTSNGDAGDYTATVSSADTSDSDPVTVTTGAAPSQFNVQIDSIAGQSSNPVVEVPDGGTTVDVAYTVENTGGKGGSTSVDIERNGNNVGDTSKTVPPGQTRSGTFSVDIGDSHISGNGITIEVTTDDDSATETVGTKALRITDHNVDDQVHPFLTEYLGNITTTVENIGSETASDTLIADVSGSNSQTSKSITIISGGSREYDMNLEEDNFGQGGYINAKLDTYGDEENSYNYATFDVRGDIWIDQSYIDQLEIDDSSSCNPPFCTSISVDFTLDVPWSGYIEDGFNRANGHAFRLVGDGSVFGDIGLGDTTGVRTESNLGWNIEYEQLVSELLGSDHYYQQFVHFFTDGNGNALEYEFPEITKWYYSDTTYCGITKDMTDYGGDEYGTPSDPGNGVDMGDAHILITDSQGDSQCNDLLNEGGFFDP
jgi:hypothetical protein